MAASLTVSQELPDDSDKKRHHDDGGSLDGALEVWIPSSIFETWIAGSMSPQLLVNGLGDETVVSNYPFIYYLLSNNLVSPRSRN